MAKALFWILIFSALVMTPLLLLIAGSLPRGTGFWSDFSLAIGYAALALLGVQFFLTARFGRATAPFGIDIIYYLHRLMAVLAFALVTAHAFVLLMAKPALAGHIYSANMPLHAAAANVSFVIFAMLIVTSVWRKRLRIPYEPWRRCHGALAVAGLLFAVIHVDMAGYYAQVPWKRSLWTMITLSWVLLLVYVRLIKPWRMRSRPYRIRSVHQERGSAWTLAVEPEGHDGLHFLPGQFVWLTIARSPFSLNEHPFSISSSAASPSRLEFTIKELGDFTRTIKDIPADTIAYLDGPFGAFTPDYFPDAPGFVFVAGGVGIAPILGILRTLADRGDSRPLVLIYGSRTWDRTICREEIDALRSRLRLEVTHVIQQATASWTGETGMLRQDVLRRHLPADSRRYEYFVCGPKPMIQVVEHAVHKLGVPLRRIHSELFDLV